MGSALQEDTQTTVNKMTPEHIDLGFDNELMMRLVNRYFNSLEQRLN